MKNLSKISKLFMILFMSVAVLSCNNDDDGTPEPPATETVTDFVIGAGDNYSILLDAVLKAELAETLRGAGPFTVFAPNNEAFQRYLGEGVGVADVSKEALTDILLNHVVSGDFKSTDLTTSYVNTLSTATPDDTNMSLYINVGDQVVLNGVSTVTGPDNEVDNGVVHLVSEVIGLPTVVTFATADPDFGILVAALTREDSFTYVNTLLATDGDNVPFTVFAPVDAAFGNLLTFLEVDGLDDIATETLAATLNLHVVATNNITAGEIADGDSTVPTLGGDITVNKADGSVTITDANGRVSTIVATDVQATNGVIHAIGDNVILPDLSPATN